MLVHALDTCVCDAFAFTDDALSLSTADCASEVASDATAFALSTVLLADCSALLSALPTALAGSLEVSFTKSLQFKLHS